jgi:DNA-binding XRE family transcriptional regulator
MSAQTIHLSGRAYVIVERDEYERLATLAKIGELPPLPEADARGNVPAVDYARASIARSIIQDRVKAGLNQRELAKRAGIRVETLCRIETGKHTASVVTIEKIDRALKMALKPEKSGKRRRA